MSAAALPRNHTAVQRLGPALVLLAALLWLFRDTATAMVGIWMRSDTFAHAILVPPISLWLAWRRRAALAALPVKPIPWLLLPIAAACLLWLLGELATVNAASQLALVTMIVLCVPALFGWPITRELLFPLGFLFFAVPIGEFLVPTLIDHTADFTVLALQLTGIPVYREGTQFVIPSGTWSVVDACSGVRYLIASLMVGTLFAYLNYRPPKRRLMFVAVAIVVPIVANWLRAYMIVMIGHLSGNTLAVGVDHLIYGWVFFGVVIGLMFLIGARWSEPEAEAVPQAGSAAVTDARPAWTWGTACGVLALLIATQGLLQRLDEAADQGTMALSLPDGGSSDPALPFQPGFNNPSVERSAAYMHDGVPVWLWVGYYRQQGVDRKLVSSTNLLVAPADKAWSTLSPGKREVALPGGAGTVRSATLRPADLLRAAEGQRLQVWQVYWVDGRFIESDARTKLAQAFARLRGRGDDGAVLLMATALDSSAEARLESFARAELPGLSARLAALRDMP